MVTGRSARSPAPSIHLAGGNQRKKENRHDPYQETNVRTASTQEDMKVRDTAKTHTSGGRRGVDSHSDEDRLGEFCSFG